MVFLPQGVSVLTNDTITTGEEEEAKTPAESHYLPAGDCCSDGSGNKVVLPGQKSRLNCCSRGPRVVLRKRNLPDEESGGTNVPSALFILPIHLHLRRVSIKLEVGAAVVPGARFH